LVVPPIVLLIVLPMNNMVKLDAQFFTGNEKLTRSAPRARDRVERRVGLLLGAMHHLFFCYYH
jgi:hypothetical protein